jgi:hypothetical protein
MRMKTSDLDGVRLAHAVGMCLEEEMHMHRGVLHTRWTKDGWKPHEDWAQGGPIIEREHIRLDCPWGDQWDASHPDSRHTAKKDGYTGWMKGPTPLIAAMRCFVASKLGDEVEVPEALI